MENSEDIDNEIDIFVVDEDDKKYMFEITPQIKYIDLLQKIQSSLKKYFFNIRHNNKTYTKDNKNDILNLEQGDTIYIMSNHYREEEEINNVPLNVSTKKSYKITNEFPGILKLFILKYIATNIENIENIKSIPVKNIISYLKKKIEFQTVPKEGINANLVEKSGNNIISYIKYINSIFNINELNNLINLFDINTKNKINKFLSVLRDYEEYDSFEELLFKEIENSYFEYSLIGISLLELKNKINYMNGFLELKNKKVIKYLFHGEEVDPKSQTIIEGLNYSAKPYYGMGIYFSDLIDFISFFSGRNKIGKTMPINSTFCCIAAEIYYDKKLKEFIFDSKYKSDELNHFPTYKEIKNNYPDKMVKKNGINIIRIELNDGQIKNKDTIIKEKRKGKFIANQYVITELDQILPLYNLTFKRNEYFVLWRDPNFIEKNKHSKFLELQKKFIFEFSKMNAYFEGSIEKSLEIVKRKKYNKIILISNIGLDLSGKRFIEIARKILGFDVMVLFFSNNKNHLKWIQNFPNALYTTQHSFYEKYIMNFNEEGLINLKKEIEQYYRIKLKFTKDFIKYPKFINEEEYKNIIFEEISPNFKKVIIKNVTNKNILSMNKNGELLFESSREETCKYLWYITIINDEITFSSNNFYLDFNNKKKILCGGEFMKIWKFEKIDDKYLFYLEEKKYTLTEDKNKAIISKENKEKNGQLFILIEEN